MTRDPATRREIPPAMKANVLAAKQLADRGWKVRSAVDGGYIAESADGQRALWDYSVGRLLDRVEGGAV